MNDEEKEIEFLTEELMHNLEIDLISGLDYCENTIKGDDVENKNLLFHQYLDKIQEHVKRCSCYTSWSGVKTLAIKCRTCSQDAEKSDDTKGLICLPCFLNGNHKGHDVQIVYSTNGNCCCGDSLYLKPEGFCCKHCKTDEHPELTQISRRERIAIISAAKALLNHLLYYSNYETITFNLLLKWMQRLIFIGDAIRRCVAIAWSQTINLFDLYQNCIHLNNEQSDLLILIIGSLINDTVFRAYFTKSLLSNLNHFVWLNSRFTLMDLSKLGLIMNRDANSQNEDTPLSHPVQFFTFACLSISRNLVSQLIRENQLEWLNISSKSLEIIHSYLFSLKEKLRSYGFLDTAQKPMLLLIDVGLKEIGRSIKENSSVDNSANLNFIDQFSAFCRKYEMSFPITRCVFGDKMNDPSKIQTIVFEFFFNIFSIIQTIKNENIISDTPIFLLDDFLQNELNSDKTDKDVSGSIFEHSVLQNGVIFSQVYSLHLLAYACCDLTTPNSKQKLAEIVTNNDVDLFLKNWILLPLRYLAACDLNQFDFFIRNDNETINVINSLRYKNNIGNNFVIIFSLIQQILLLYKNKEEILEIICHTYGLFLTSRTSNEKDNNESDLMEKQIHGRLFAFLHFICSLIFDDICYKRDYFTMRRFAVITHLKFKMSGMIASQIDEVWPNHPMSDVKFIDDLPNFTTEVTGGYSGTIYKLKNDVKWHPILPFLDTCLILQAIQDFCNKNPSSLIPFPEIPDEIALDKERTPILFQPLLFAFEYLILADYSSFQELLQLTLNLLIITKKSTSHYDDKSDSNTEQKEQIVAQNLLDLVNQLKGFTFSQFLNIKISLLSSQASKKTQKEEEKPPQPPTENSEPTQKVDDTDNDKPQLMKSAVDLISELGELGQTVLTQLGFHITSPTATNKNDNNNNNDNDNNNNEDESPLSAPQSTAPQSSVTSPPLAPASAPPTSKSNKANLLKMQILQNFKDQQKSFSDANEVSCDQDSSKFECCVCRCSTQQNSSNFDDYLFYPCLSYKTIVPTVIDSKQIVKTVSLRICMHPIHKKCVDIEASDDGRTNSSSELLKKLVHFQCPIDRCPRNCLLPIVTTEFEPIPPNSPLTSLLTNFVQSAYGIETFIVDIVRSYCAEIQLLEVRSRDYPACLDSLATQTTLHLVYLAIWHTRSHEADYILDHDDDSITPLMKYILILISLGPRDGVDPHDVVHAVAREMPQMAQIVQLIRFLRCCAIFDYYGRNDKKFFEEKVQEFMSTHKRNHEKHHARRMKKKGDKGQHIGSCTESHTNLSQNRKIDEEDDENILKSSSSFFSSMEQMNENVNENNNNNDDDNNDSNVSIDWDVVLSPEFLFYYYNIGFSSDVSIIIKENYNVLFPPFDFTNIPDNFLDFMKDPYSINIANTIDGEIAICLFTHKCVSLPSSSKSVKTQNTPPSVSDFLKTTLKKTFSVFLVLNGPQASSVIICDLKTNKIIRIKGFYVDQFDEEDPGLKKGHLLTLSQAKKKETIDNVLSGNWTNYRTW